ncbi:MAG: hypothetical protein R3F53_14775 [Gammaproteobacteria bacterium]
MQGTLILIIGKNAKTGLRVNRRLQVLGYSRLLSELLTVIFDGRHSSPISSAGERSGMRKQT